MSHIIVTGVPPDPTRATPPPRLEINKLIADEKQFSLYIQALRTSLRMLKLTSLSHLSDLFRADVRYTPDSRRLSFPAWRYPRSPVPPLGRCRSETSRWLPFRWVLHPWNRLVPHLVRYIHPAARTWNSRAPPSRHRPYLAIYEVRTQNRGLS